VCGPYASYPADCTRRVSADFQFCVNDASLPHAYLCDTSVLSTPCSVAALNERGGMFCCP